MGLLPELDPLKIPQEVGASLAKRLDAVVDSVKRLDPGATVDSCRHALAIVFGYLAENRELDLGEAIKVCLRDGKITEGVRTWAGGIVAKLHVRTKPNEERRLKFRGLDDGDAQLAVECLAVVLKDIGWVLAG